MAIKISYRFAKSWESHSLDMLELELRDILNAPPTPNSPSRGRDRYTKAFRTLAQFFQEHDFNPAIVNEFRELASALDELEHGTVRPFLRPTKAGNRHLDPGDIWSARAFVAIALDFLVSRESISTRDAAKHLGDLAGGLVASFPTAKNFEGAARGWHKALKNGTCSSARALKLFNERHELIEKVDADLTAEGRSVTTDAVIGDIMQVALALATQAADSNTLSSMEKQLRRPGI